jgi:rubredoxin
MLFSLCSTWVTLVCEASKEDFEATGVEETPGL